MIELVMAVCLIDQPKRCRDVTMTFEGEQVSNAECYSTGQIEIAKWSGEHPNWIIKKWGCGIAGSFAKL